MTQVTLVAIKGSDEDFKQIARWDNQEDVLPYLTVNQKEGPHERVNPQDMITQHSRHPDKKFHYWIMVDDTPVGVIDYMVDPEHLYIKVKNTAWLGLCVGEKAYWGKGVAKEAMGLMEDLLKSKGLYRVELGVFAYNLKAKALYEKMGYRQIATIKHFTYYDGQWHDDIRFEKRLDLVDV